MARLHMLLVILLVWAAAAARASASHPDQSAAANGPVLPAHWPGEALEWPGLTLGFDVPLPPPPAAPPPALTADDPPATGGSNAGENTDSAASAPEPLPPPDRPDTPLIPFGGMILGSEAWPLWNPDFWDPWEGSVELGLSGTEGNSQTFNVRFGLSAKHKTERLVQTLQITSIQKSADGVTTANTALVDGRIEWPMPESRWNYYVHGLLEYDQFKAFEYRLSGDTGFGYEFIQTPATLLIGRTGISASQEVGGPDDKLNPEWALGAEFKHKFNPTHSISAKADYFPNLTDFGDFRLNSQAGWEIALSTAWGLSLKLTVIDRYDSTPQGRNPNDLDYSTVLLWQF